MNDFIFEYNEPFYMEVDSENAGERVDKYLADMLSSFSRSQLQKLIKDGKVQCGKDAEQLKPVKANYKLDNGDIISLAIPEPEELNIEPEDIPLDILYEDDDLIVVNKPKGMVVHPAPGHYTGTLVNALLYTLFMSCISTFFNFVTFFNLIIIYTIFLCIFYNKIC